jgi:hypothetical protein
LKVGWLHFLLLVNFRLPLTSCGASIFRWGGGVT